MWLQNLSQLLNDPRRRNIILITLFSLLTMLFVGGVRLLTQARTKGLRGAANIESVGSIHSIPGGSKRPTTTNYARLQMEQNKRMAEQAKRTGRSAIATIVDGFNVEEPKVAAINSDLQPPVQAPLLSETERAIKDHQTFMSQQQTELTKQQIQGAMYQQMNQLFNTWSRSPMQEYAEGATANHELSVQANSELFSSKPTLIKAGTIFNARLLTEINSDEPSPVLAQITTGEFKDARLIGTLSLVGERVLVQFHSLSLPEQSRTFAIKALAVDETTAKTSLAAQVDRHVWLRYGSLVGASFLHQYGMTAQKASESKLYNALLANLDPRRYLLSATGGMGTHLGSELAQQINRRPTVYVHAGTVIGVLFSSDLVGSSSKE